MVAYAPTEEAPEVQKARYMAALNCTVASVPARECVFVLTDTNDKVALLKTFSCTPKSGAIRPKAPTAARDKHVWIISWQSRRTADSSAALMSASSL